MRSRLYSGCHDCIDQNPIPACREPESFQGLEAKGSVRLRGVRPRVSRLGRWVATYCVEYPEDIRISAILDNALPLKLLTTRLGG